VKLSVYPPFRVQCTVLVHLCDGKSSHHPDARLRVTFYISHREDIFSGSTNAAKSTLARLGVPEAALEHAVYEYEVDGFIAVEPRGVKNPDREPIEAFSTWFFADLTERKKATLIRQRRLVPEDQREMIEWYATPARKAELAAREAVPA
jgi:hypothetical protein